MASSANGYRAGSAYIAVSPNFKGFQTDLAAKAKTLRPIKVPVEYDTKNPLIKPPEPVKVPVQLDTKGGSFERKLQAQVRAASAALGDIEIGAATNEAEQKIRDLKAELAALAGKRIGVDIDTRDALSKIVDLQADLTVLGERSPDIHVQVDAAEATAKLGEVLVMADAVGAREPDVHVNAETTEAQGKLAALWAEITAMEVAHPLITIGIALAPLAAPLGAAIAGGGMGLAAIGGALAGGAAAGILGGIVLKQAIDGQKKLTQATKDRLTAVQGVQSAEKSLASAENSANNAQISATRAVADAERSLADARRQGARAISTAEQGLADARRSAARADAAATEQVTNAEQQLADANKNVRESEKAVHAARVQAIRDLQDLRAQVRQNALDVRAAQFAAEDAQAKLADIETNVFASSDDVARARLAAAQAEQKVADARRKSTRDAQDLAKAERSNGGSLGGVQAARQQLAQAREQQAQAQKQLADARRSAAQTRADGARAVARAEQNLAQTRADAARQVATAERNLSRTRADGARQVAQAQQQVADAQQRVKVAQDKLTLADQARAKALAALTPAQRKLLAGLTQLRKAWHAFLGDIGAPLAGAGLAGMHAIEKALPSLAAYLKPVYRSLRDVFGLLGGTLAGKGAKQTAHFFGVFSGHIIRDAFKGTRNVAAGLVDLFRAFVPFSKSMSSGIVGLTKRFRDWADGLGKSKGFQQFIGYVKDNGPKILSVLGGLVRLFIGLGTALAPLGSLMLKGLEKLFGWLSKLSPGQLIAIAGGITAVWVALSGGTLAVVAAVVAIGGALVYAYKHVHWFRKGVDTAWKAIRAAFSWAWEHVIHPVLKALWGYLTHVVFPVISALWKYFIKPYLKLAGAWIKFQWDTFIHPILKAFWGFLTNVLFPVIRFLWNKVVKPIFGWIASHIHDQYNQHIKPILQAFARFIGTTLPNAFSDGADAIGRFWNKIKGWAAAPVNFLIRYVYNDGIRKLINAIPGVTDLKPLAEIPTGGGGGSAAPPTVKNSGQARTFNAATGGVLPGWSPGRDVHHFTSPTGGRLNLSGGEAFMVPEWTRAVGGPAAVARMNKAARAGRMGHVEGFASGGVFANPDSKAYINGMAISKIAAAQVALARQVSGLQIYMMQGGYGGNHVAASGTSHNYPGVGDFGPGSIALEKILRQVGFAAWARNIPGRSQVGSGAHVHAVSLLDPGDRSSPQVYGSWANHGNGLYGSNNDPAPHYPWLPNLQQRLGAVNLSALGGGGDGKGGGGFIHVAKEVIGIFGDIKKWIGQLVNMGGWGGLIKQMAVGVVDELRSWVNGKIPGPGPVPAIFDDGGQLPHGLTMAYHGARKPDKVLTDAQWNDLHRLAARGATMPAKFDLYDSSNQLIGTMTGIARSAVNGTADFHDARAAAGMR